MGRCKSLACWNLFDTHLYYLGPISTFSPSWIPLRVHCRSCCNSWWLNGRQRSLSRPFDFLQGLLHCLLFVGMLLFFFLYHIVSLVPGECKLLENLHFVIVYYGYLGWHGRRVEMLMIEQIYAPNFIEAHDVLYFNVQSEVWVFWSFCQDSPLFCHHWQRPEFPLIQFPNHTRKCNFN